MWWIIRIYLPDRIRVCFHTISAFAHRFLGSHAADHTLSRLCRSCPSHFPAVTQRPSALREAASPAGPAPSSTVSSIRPPSPGFCSDNVGTGVSRHVQPLARVPRARTGGGARNGSRPATTPMLHGQSTTRAGKRLSLRSAREHTGITSRGAISPAGQKPDVNHRARVTDT
jgi:hypothetical protein